MTKFEVGDKFIPRKPKDVAKSPAWRSEMDKYDGKELTVDGIDDFGRIQAEGGCWNFHPDWCEKVEENSVNFVQREGDTISIEATLSTSATATLGDVKKPFLIVTTNHHEGIKYAEGTAKAPYEPYIPLIPLSANHVPEVRKTIDWEQRRYELAKAAMQSIVTNSSMLNLVASKGERSMVDWTVIVCQNAIIMADEMIKQLKQR